MWEPSVSPDILSFRTVSWACWISALFILAQILWALKDTTVIGCSLFPLFVTFLMLVVTGAFLCWKSMLTLKSIVEQEEVVVIEEWPKFYSTLLNIIADRRVAQTCSSDGTQ